jgi:hypothetical protein
MSLKSSRPNCLRKPVGLGPFRDIGDTQIFKSPVIVEFIAYSDYEHEQAAV